MINYVLRRRIIVGGLIAVALFCVALLFNFISGLFANESKSTETDSSQQALLSTTTESSVSMEIRKELVADESMSSFSIVITPNSRIVTSMIGYEKRILAQKVYTNNKSAYEQFVYALNRADLLNNRNLNDEENDTRGVCPAGELTVFNIAKSQSIIKKIWTTSCKDSKGNLKSSVSKITDLFLTQIPEDAKSIVSEI